MVSHNQGMFESKRLNHDATKRAHQEETLDVGVLDIRALNFGTLKFGIGKGLQVARSLVQTSKKRVQPAVSRGVPPTPMPDWTDGLQIAQILNTGRYDLNVSSSNISRVSLCMSWKQSSRSLAFEVGAQMCTCCVL
jgi:hypothetical protein